MERLREVLQMEQFNSVLENDVRLWLLDQKPKSLAEAVKLADQYVAVHKPGRTTQKTFDGKSKTSFNGHENKSYAQSLVHLELLLILVVIKRTLSPKMVIRIILIPQELFAIIAKNQVTLWQYVVNVWQRS